MQQTALPCAMPRISRVASGGMVFHVLNRGVGGQRLLSRPSDYEAFEDVVAETLEKIPMRIGSYCVVPNHWHFVLWPEHAGDFAAFMQRLTVPISYSMRKNGSGPVYGAVNAAKSPACSGHKTKCQ